MGKKIAYVEDDQDMIDLVSIILERYDCRVQGFEHAEGAVGEMADLGPDLIILDLMMPRMDGFEVYRLIKEHEALRSVPVVVISAMKKAVEQIEKEGRIKVEGCLVKPFSIDELVETIKKALPDLEAGAPQ
jgi:CheY-like chemotaxis protein